MVEVDKAPVDRISLNSKNRKKLDQWLLEVNAQLNGMVKVTRTDLVNCLLEIHGSKLSDSEIKASAKYCFDEVRWLNSAMERLKAAKKTGEALTMETLLGERRTLLGEDSKPLKGRPKKPEIKDQETYEIQASKAKRLSDAIRF